MYLLRVLVLLRVRTATPARKETIMPDLFDRAALLEIERLTR